MVDVERLYDEAGFRGRIGFGSRPALLIIDLNRGFTDPASPLGSEMDDVVAANRQLLDAARHASIPVVFTTMAYDDVEAEVGPWIRKVPGLRALKLGEEWAAIDERLEPRETEPIVVKKFTSAFFETELDRILRDADVDTVIVTGTATSGCVRAAALDATQRRYRTIIPREAVGDRAVGPHEASLFDLDSKWADVVSLDEALEFLRGLK